LRASLLPPHWRFNHHRKCPEAKWRYRTETVEAGFGGDEHLLQAWEANSHDHLWIEQTVQTEAPADADFAVAWRIAESTRVSST
jgi:hypothetical protein